MAVELKRRGVASISLWPGAVKTELISQYILDDTKAENSEVGSSLAANVWPMLAVFDVCVCVCAVLSSVKIPVCQRRNHRTKWEVYRQPGQRWDSVFFYLTANTVCFT